MKSAFITITCSVFLSLVFLALSTPCVVSAQETRLEDLSLSDLMNVQVESASKQVEPWAEAPVPMTIITKDMIKLAGVRTVEEALVLFVPGFTHSQDRNEVVFATRGIYATSQQKVLIMLNGHRLNSRSYLASMPDMGIAIHNLERIEVLRGPGSSLYGNVALAGVVNLITRKGADVGKTSFEGSLGNWGQNRIRFLTGNGGTDWDLLAWGQRYQADGEAHDLNGSEKYNPGKTGRILIGGVDKKPAHDVGVNYQTGHWTYMMASRRSQYIEPYGSGNNPYEYGAFRTFEGSGPGLSMEQQHFGMTYTTDDSGAWNFEINPTFDRTNVQGILAEAGNSGTVVSWQDESIGLNLQGNWRYQAAGDGTIVMGAQIDHYRVLDSVKVLMVNGDFTTTDPATGARLLEPGEETIYSAFIQDKHKFNSQWILNGGARYDHKLRRRGDPVTKLSPRLALIYLPNETWEYKLSYSQSFVDAPYWYRYNKGLASFGGSESLNPEVLNTVQFQTAWKSADRRLRNAAALYYQKGVDLISNRASAAGTPADPKYINSGRIESAGVENEFSYLSSSYQAFWNLQYARAVSTVDYARFDEKFAHVPALTSNLILNFLWSSEMTANLTIKYVGPQAFNSGTIAAPVEQSVDGVVLLNLGGRLENLGGSGFYLDARIYNLLDTEFYQGGQSGTQIPFRQAGRWYLATLGREF